jgi:HK97 family phage prohead protease
MDLPRFDTALELKLLAETGEFEGYAAVFGVTDTVNDRIAPGAFQASLDEGKMPPLLWQHDPKQPIGVWREMREDAHGLFVRGELFINDIPRAREAYKLLRENVVTGLSIGYRAKQSHRDSDTGARVLTDIDLVEISMVTFPANDFARVRRVKSVLEGGGVPSQKEFEAFLRDAGLSRKQAKGVIASGYKSLSLRDADDGDDTDICGEIYALAEIIRKATPNN